MQFILNWLKIIIYNNNCKIQISIISLNLIYITEKNQNKNKEIDLSKPKENIS